MKAKIYAIVAADHEWQLNDSARRMTIHDAAEVVAAYLPAERDEAIAHAEVIQHEQQKFVRVIEVPLTGKTIANLRPADPT